MEVSGRKLVEGDFFQEDDLFVFPKVSGALRASLSLCVPAIALSSACVCGQPMSPATLLVSSACTSFIGVVVRGNLRAS